MRRERVRQPKRRGKLRTEEARAQDPDRHIETRTRHRTHRLAGLRGPKIVLELDHVAREVVDVPRQSSPERVGGALVSAGCPPDPEVDPARMERFERPELFGDDEGRVVRQHDTAGADTNSLRPGGDMIDDNRCGSARDSRHIVVFGEPVALEAPYFGMLREIQRVAKSQRRVAAFNDWREIENGQRHHRVELPSQRRLVLAFSPERGDKVAGRALNRKPPLEMI